MANFSISDVSSPLFLGGAISSYALLVVLQICEVTAQRREQDLRFDRTLLIWRSPETVRIRSGRVPLLKICPGDIACFLSVRYILGPLLSCEPMTVVPFATSWLCLLCGEIKFALIAAVVGYAWRILLDWHFIRSRADAGATLTRKLLFCTGVGIYVATIVYFIIWMLVVLLCVLAFAGAGAGKKYRRRDR